MDIRIIKNSTDLKKKHKTRIINFLHEHLDEYGDEWEDIEKAFDYAMKDEPNSGGFFVIAEENDTIYGAVIMNKTGMQGYIPENILVYIAVHKAKRGTGLGKQLMLEAIKNSDGNLKLHVEKENPARFLYEKVGFTNPYLEMRYVKDK